MIARDRSKTAGTDETSQFCDNLLWFRSGRSNESNALVITQRHSGVGSEDRCCESS